MSAAVDARLRSSHAGGSRFCARRPSRVVRAGARDRRRSGSHGRIGICNRSGGRRCERRRITGRTGSGGSAGSARRTERGRCRGSVEAEAGGAASGGGTMSRADELQTEALMREALQRITQLQDRVGELEAARHEPLAIVGLGCRFPGASDPQAYWTLLHEGRDAVTEIPRSRWDIDAWYDPNPDTPGKMHTRDGGFVDAIERFDAAFFGISPREALMLDPQQRLLLETTWEALEHAGIAPESLAGTRGGVFVGIGGVDYYQRLAAGAAADIDAYVASGNAHSTASGRLSFTLNLHGPCVSIDTACSSSLVAVHLACQSLRQRECDVALAGGVNLLLSPTIHLNHSRARMLAPDGRCKAFDAAADGFVRSEGC